MRLLHINSGNLYGGIEVLLVTLARRRELCPAMVPEFALCFPGRTQGELAATGALVHILGRVAPAGLGRFGEHAAACESCSAQSALRRRCVPWFVVAGGLWPSGPQHECAAGVLAACSTSFAAIALAGGWASWCPPDLTICNSDFTRAAVARQFPKCRSVRIYCPVDFPDRPGVTDERRAIRKKYCTAEKDVVILQVGRWDPYKGHTFLLEALARLADLPNWTCWQVAAAQTDAERAYVVSLQQAAAGRHCGACTLPGISR